MAAMEGTLSKWTNVMKGWQNRWFVLDDNAGLLSYYTSREKMMRGVRRGCVRLKGAVIGIDDEDASTFTVTVDGKTFHFQARNPEEREKWIRAMEDTILRHAPYFHSRNHHQRHHSPPPPSMHHQLQQLTKKVDYEIPTIQDFDKKVVEADTFLQILIDQVKALEDRIGKIDSQEEKQNLVVIYDIANEMLESIKHSIVLLQIAKNTAHPVNGIYQATGNSMTSGSHSSQEFIPSLSPISLKAHPRDTHSQVDASGVRIADLGRLQQPPGIIDNAKDTHPLLRDITDSGESTPRSNSLNSSVPPVILPSSVQTGIEVGAECLEGAATVPQIRRSRSHLTVAASAGYGIPETSYSSSEGDDDEDDDFYDADDYLHAMSPTGSRPFQDAVEDLGASGAGSSAAPVASGTTKADEPESEEPAPVIEVAEEKAFYKDGALDYDALYEDDSERDLGTMDGNVVTHLLSQMKIGMDLTKVALPTFILERRSLLEMYADYFAHPDLFVSIADFTDPRDRMVQVLRWYLSSYHAGRKSAVARKPYNPVLGEIFQCYWDIPPSTHSQISSSAESSKTGESKTLVSDGPVPWCTQSQLTFVAEQVSHHPPISAFYAEHYSKRISFCAHVWTKSKFLGLSIGVHNIGQGCVSVLDYGEEYILTFPNGYGRSILRVPWIELGGTVNITCARTGYYATIEFHTKPFYGGKRHRITAECFYAPPDPAFPGGTPLPPPTPGKSFLTVAGEWNGLMEAKWADGRTETFVDVNALKIVKKIVRPISEQNANESRRLWKEVTAGLRLNDIERATNAKCALEQRQREEAKERKESGQKWETKVFHEAGENWVYCSPLGSRLSNDGVFHQPNG
ncbi:oxysterol-binding protein-related protein 9 isoform X1 [Ischnura elegans]|uniref:oxysterol-binding protein-related protein 9 isoform X1 n=2 Tax=Ischnura elegans TaxID=197161 RepID=UPI001ED8B18E|nr:oxysterol-binding protein-related protein 9 isoform X1 [Ischnura elegans]XP_046387862.1 oxysterol-binding protein-related protein 9 isoform X1 [Ischnura elegans]